jgi:hypothetical protein
VREADRLIESVARKLKVSVSCNVRVREKESVATREREGVNTKVLLSEILSDRVVVKLPVSVNVSVGWIERDAEKVEEKADMVNEKE